MSRRFTAEQIEQICKLKNQQSQRAIGQQFNCSAELIRQVWAGIIYRDLLPDWYQPNPRPGDPSCTRCREWRGDACRMGFPDPVLEGVGFARDCSLYEVA